MPASATSKRYESPQIVLEKLASKNIAENDAKQILESYWKGADKESTLRKILSVLFGSSSVTRSRR